MNLFNLKNVYSKSIKNKILISIVLVVIIGQLIVGCIFNIGSNLSTKQLLKKTMEESVELASDRVSSQIKDYKKLIKEIANNPIVTDESFSLEQKIEFLEDTKARNVFTSIDLLDGNGIGVNKNVNLSNEEYFYYCKNNNDIYVSTPFLRTDNGIMGIVISSPIKSKGEFKGVLVVGIYCDFLSKIVQNINIGDNGLSYILDKDGYIIAHNEQKNVLFRQNNIKTYKTDNSLKDIVKYENKMINGESGFGVAEIDGINRFLAYTPILGTDGWSIIITANKHEFMKPLLVNTIINIIIVILIIAIGCIIASCLAEKLSNPIRIISNRLQGLSNGDLTSDVKIVNTDDEIGELSNSLAKTIGFLKVYIKDIDDVLNKLANGDLSPEINREYIGDFGSIKKSMELIISSLNVTLLEINESSNQVYTGSDQVEQASKTLSQGAMDQASTIEELSATLDEIFQQVKQNANFSNEASELSLKSSVEVEKSNEKMNELIVAMNKIEKSSKQIINIIKTINDIAEQTNLLSLNASIEAARAGEAGKGFVVVAEEVRNLAMQSANATKNIENLINNSIEAVNNGTIITDETAKFLSKVVNTSKETTSIIDEISNSCNNQAVSIEQIVIAINQISDVVQSNSAISEETAAASEELSLQSENLKELINKFKLK
ncbi:methyl-accepting chemotaxis protein [Clostridium taeniosporum]|uniref:Methyl-accepting chemotaxis protein n=1 Tax=Clostridium taeniosporum TaxID=394958 RepID=A0A1D7XMH2_9CLOT|nr:methyl-accepting chemotaxis protein [Clostridium taeniosporum]AOR24524.1 hypothetical protein BGI42_12595 [Clostridium taeniosporum]